MSYVTEGYLWSQTFHHLSWRQSFWLQTDKKIFVNKLTTFKRARKKYTGSSFKDACGFGRERGAAELDTTAGSIAAPAFI